MLDIILAILAVIDAVLVLLVMLAIFKLPPLLERIASNTAAQQQQLREVLAEIRKVSQA